MTPANEILGDIGALRRAAGRAAARAELPWLKLVRSRAFEDFAARGFPTTAEEDWRYTDLRPAAALVAERATDPGSAPAARLDPTLRDRLPTVPTAAIAIVMDGRLRPDLSQLQAAGLTLTPFSAVQPQRFDEIAARLSRRSPATSENPLASLNTALLPDGLCIDIAPGAHIAEPIQVVVAGNAATVAHTRLLVTLGAGSKATLLEHHVSLGAALSNTVTDLHCERAAELAYVKLQDEAESATHLAAQYLTMADDSRARLLHLDLGARLARNDLAVELTSAGASLVAHGLFFADGSRHLDNHTRIDHCAPRTTSLEVYRGIADGKGRGVFNGKVLVRKGAAGTDARLVSQNLLLSAGAEIDTKPELEIYADDVKCSHGATTGQLDAGAIFYLRSRGISAEQARRMLIASFAREIIRQLPGPALENHVVHMMGARLPEMAEVAEQS